MMPSAEHILVAAPTIVVRDRRPNVKTGVIGIVPLGGQGAGQASQFEADVDADPPITRAYAIGGQQGESVAGSSYLYVSRGSTEVMLVAVRDTTCDCTFDVQLRSLDQGHDQTTTLTNGGNHFHIVGSAGLPWYQGNPLTSVPFTRVTAHDFPAR